MTKKKVHSMQEQDHLKRLQSVLWDQHAKNAKSLHSLMTISVNSSHSSSTLLYYFKKKKDIRQ